MIKYFITVWNRLQIYIKNIVQNMDENLDGNDSQILNPIYLCKLNWNQ